MSIAPFYGGWHLTNESLIAAIADLTPEQLALPIVSAAWPVWASISHIAGARVYWLCHVFGEPGAGATPFSDPNAGWEDDLARPRRADELVHALTSSWQIVEHTLSTWTPDTLTREAHRTRNGQVRIHTRQSVLMRLITQDTDALDRPAARQKGALPVCDVEALHGALQLLTRTTL